MFGPPYKPRDDDTPKLRGGMSGTASRDSARVLLMEIQRCMVGPYELIDIGAGSSSFLAASFAFGAECATGIEIKNEGQNDIFHHLPPKFPPLAYQHWKSFKQTNRNCSRDISK